MFSLFILFCVLLEIFISDDILEFFFGLVLLLVKYLDVFFCRL